MNTEHTTPGAERLLVTVALGSNLGDSKGIIRSAMHRLQDDSATPLLRSSLFRSTPVECPPGAPDYVNAVVGLTPRPGETPETLLDKLLKLECEFGRGGRKSRNESRTLDLDLITFGVETRDDGQLTLPHPRAHRRRFVLEPLAEIAPDLVLPGQSQTVRELLAGLAPDETVDRLR